MAADHSNETPKMNLNIDNYRKLVQTYINLHMYEAALFWADKVSALTNQNPKDVYWQAQCMYLLKQYHRAAHLLTSRNLDKMYVLCNYLTVKCLLDAYELTEALKVLELLDMDVLLQNGSTSNISDVEFGFFDDTPRHQIQSSILLLKGKVYEAMDNRGLASDCYRQALQCDVHCFEAFESLIQHHMLTAAEEEDLMHSLPISKQCTAEESEVLLLLYRSKLKKYHTPFYADADENRNNAQNNLDIPLNGRLDQDQSQFNTLPSEAVATVVMSTPNGNDHSEKKEGSSHREPPTVTDKTSPTTAMQIEENPVISKLQGSLDYLVTQAEQMYYNCDYQKCQLLTENILKTDPYHNACLPIYISCQVELKQSRKLFTLAHRLVDLYPNLAISWFAVGCYYYVIGKSDSARRYLVKATTLDRLFGPAWLAYGHSFAVENEHDQAMAAYFKAAQLMKGCHLPLLYIGLECGMTNNVVLATKYFDQAIKIAPNDPFVLHEMGVVAFQTTNYALAEKYFRDAIRIVKSNSHRVLLPERWAPLLNNLGHTLRKQKKYQDALEYHHEALVISPQTASTYSAIAYVHSLVGNLLDAVQWFHKALGLRRDDTFSTTMLNYVLEQVADDEIPYVGAPDHIPDFDLQNKTANNTTQEIPSDGALEMSIENDIPG